MKQLSLLMIAIAMCISCKSQTIEKGKIYNNIKLQKDTTLSYAIYLPKKASVNKLAFLFFDPHGDGFYPISLYKNLAEQFGIILIGNNNAQNGMDFNTIFSNYIQLSNELNAVYNLGSANICVWGFSGGAKAAMYCSNNSKAIGYCIYSGSVLPLQNSIECLGFNGTKDMNYTDLLSYDFSQTQNNSHLQIEFNGKHAWCDTITAINAFRWFLLKKMQRNEIKRDKAFITKCYTSFKKEFDNALAAKQYRNAFLIGKKIVLCLNDLYDVTPVKVAVGKLVNDINLKKEMKALEMNYNLETTTKVGYQANFLAKDTTYWKQEITQLIKKTKSDKSGINERLLGYLSLASYSYANKAFSQYNIADLEKILFIYQMSDPTNPEQALMRAKLWMLKKDAPNAKACIQEAIQLGAEQSRIDSDAVLKALQ